MNKTVFITMWNKWCGWILGREGRDWLAVGLLGLVIFGAKALLIKGYG